MEKRGLKYHRGRVGEALREEIETLVEGELADPRIGLVSVTAVHIADDGRSAEVWVNVEGDDADADQSIEGLEAAKEYIRHELVERLRLRRKPTISSKRNSCRKSMSNNSSNFISKGQYWVVLRCSISNYAVCDCGTQYARPRSFFSGNGVENR